MGITANAGATGSSSWSVHECRYGFNNQEQETELGVPLKNCMNFLKKNHTHSTSEYSFDTTEGSSRMPLVIVKSNYKQYRVQDAWLGRFLSVDPLEVKYAWNSSYAFEENEVIKYIDLEGKERAEPEDYLNTVKYLTDLRNEYTGYYITVNEFDFTKFFETAFEMTIESSEVFTIVENRIFIPPTKKDETVYGEHDKEYGCFSGLKMTNLMDDLINTLGGNFAQLNGGNASDYSGGKYAIDNYLKNTNPMRYAKLIIDIADNGEGSYDINTLTLTANPADLDILNGSSRNLGSSILVGALIYNTNVLGPIRGLLKYFKVGELQNESTFPKDLKYILSAYFGLRVELAIHYLICQDKNFSKTVLSADNFKLLLENVDLNMAILFDDHVISEVNGISAGRFGYHFITLHSLALIEGENQKQVKLSYYTHGEIKTNTVDYEKCMHHIMGCWIVTKYHE